MRSLHIRPATVDDVAAIQAIGLRTWPATYLPCASPEFVIDGLTRWWSAAFVRGTIERDTTLVAEVDGDIVGTTTLGRLGDDHVVWKLYVVPEHQGTGAGHALLQAAIDRVPATEDVTLEHVEGNERAARFYARHGFAFDRRETPEDGPAEIWLRRPGARAG